MKNSTNLLLTLLASCVLISCGTEGETNSDGTFGTVFKFNVTKNALDSTSDVKEYVITHNTSFNASDYPTIYDTGYTQFTECVLGTQQRLSNEDCQPLWAIDSDWDGIANNEDLDDDNDGIADISDQYPLDTDNDGIENGADDDIDNDGYNNSEDGNVFVFADQLQPNISFDAQLTLAIQKKTIIPRTIQKEMTLYRDINNDNNLEKIEIKSSTNLTEIYIYPDSENDSEFYTIHTYEDIWTESKNFSINDINSDGYADLIFSNYGTGELTAVLYSSTASYSNPSNELVMLRKAQNTVFHIGFVDNDNIIDVIATTEGRASDYGVLFIGNGKAGLTKVSSNLPAECPSNELFSLVLANSFFKKAFLEDEALPGMSVLYDKSLSGYDKFSFIGDFNNDGKLDVRVRGTQLVLIQESPCNFSVTVMEEVNVPSFYDCFQNVDLDKDGDLDYLSIGGWPLGITYEQNISVDGLSKYYSSTDESLPSHFYGRPTPWCTNGEGGYSEKLPSGLGVPYSNITFSAENDYRVYFSVSNEAEQETTVELAEGTNSPFFNLDTTSNYIEYTGDKTNTHYLSITLEITDPYFKINSKLFAKINADLTP